MTKETIIKYIEGHSSPTESESVERWFLEEIESDELDSILIDVLNESPCCNDMKARQAFVSMCQRNGLELPKQKRLTRFMYQWTHVAAAAVLVCIMTLGAYMLGTSQQEGKSLQWTEVYAGIGDSKLVTLPDSSTILLKPSSMLLYETTAFKTNRKVYLTGEAYAEVTKDAKHPFEMKCNGITVNVLGTKFNVQSYQTDSEAEVILYEGAVKVKSTLGGREDAVMMSPGNIVKFDQQSGKRTGYNISNISYSQNTSDFYFIDKKLGDIVNQLERRFNKNIIIGNPQLESMKYYAIFVNNENLDQILSSLNSSGRMNITYLDNNTIEIK